MRGRVEHHAEMLESGGSTARPAPQQRANARRQLIEIERFGEVVVGARVQPLHAIGDRIARGDDEHGQRLAAGSQGLQELETVHAGEPQVEQQKLERLTRQRLRRGPRVVDPVDGESLSLEARTDGLADHCIVLYQQQSHGPQSMINRVVADRFSEDKSRAAAEAANPRAAAPRAANPDEVEPLRQDAARLGVALTAEDAVRLLRLLDELGRWNRRYNLTAIRTPETMVTHHLLDSLAVHPDLVGQRIADVGTGAGFPGLPLAVCNPGRQFTLIDSTAKKIRFVTHAAALLGLTNVTAVHARAEGLQVSAPFDTVVARAFAPLPQLLSKVTRLCGPQSRVLAMKGKWPEAELAALPAAWRVIDSRELSIPHLEAERCVIVLATRASTPASHPAKRAVPADI